MAAALLLKSMKASSSIVNTIEDNGGLGIGIERETGKCFLVEVADRTRDVRREDSSVHPSRHTHNTLFFSLNCLHYLIL